MPNSTDAFGDEFFKQIGAAIGKEAVNLVSSFGRKVFPYFIQLPQVQNKSASEHNYPPMIIVGLGRCGCFVTGQLAAMLSRTEDTANSQTQSAPQADKNQILQAGATPPPNSAASDRSLSKWIENFFVKNDQSNTILSVEPKMFMGDIDETIFRDVILSMGSSSSAVSERLLQISYEPLALGGVGNTPIFSEFLTRGLLLLPPAKLDGRDNPWTAARTLLLDNYSVYGQRLRLAFYIFAASGGTGSGAANEFLRAQRFALAGSGVPHQVFFCGIAVLPRGNLLQHNQTHQRNAGRLLTQYLSELNIDLSSPMSFRIAPKFSYDVRVRVDVDLAQSSSNEVNRLAPPELPLVPWDAMLFISNDVMPTQSSGNGNSSFEDADSDANKYIAQCMFNISSSQLPIAQIRESDRRTENRNYQSRRLDPNDMRTGLTGPVCAGFSAVSVAGAQSDERWVERLFAAALALPNRRNADRPEFESAVQGISICPEPKDAYAEKLSKLDHAVQSNEPKALEDALRSMSQVRLFYHCPRAILIFTSPQTGDIPASIEDRLDSLMNALCPNLVQLRTAIVRGTTTLYTTTILFEGSVINAPDVISSFVNYLWYSFARSDLTEDQFDEALKNLLNRPAETALTISDVEHILNESEDWEKTVPNYLNQVTNWESNWTLFKESQRGTRPNIVKKSADQHRMDNFIMKREQVVSALNYVRYARHFGKRQPRPVDPFL